MALVSATALVLTGCGFGASAAPAPTGAKDSLDTGALSAAIEEEMTRDGIPGLVVHVRSESHGDWSQAFGTRDIAADTDVTTDDLFRLGDITHTLTATTILALQEQDLLSLQDPISMYVPDVPGGDSITLDDLGRNNSGLFSYDDDEDFHAAFMGDPQREWAPQELLDFSFAHPVTAGYTDQATIGYSNTDYVLLGMVIERVTGTDAADAVKTLVLDPLGLESMGLSDGDALPEPHAAGHVYAESPFGTQVLDETEREAVEAGSLRPTVRSGDNLSWEWTAGGAYGTAADLADFFEAMIDGPLLDAETRDERVADLLPILAPGPETIEYGFGIARFGQYYVYSGQTIGYNSLVAYDPIGKTSIAIVSNLMAEDDGGAPIQGIFASIADAIDPVAFPGS